MSRYGCHAPVFITLGDGRSIAQGADLPSRWVEKGRQRHFGMFIKESQSVFGLRKNVCPTDGYHDRRSDFLYGEKNGAIQIDCSILVI